MQKPRLLYDDTARRHRVIEDARMSKRGHLLEKTVMLTLIALMVVTVFNLFFQVKNTPLDIDVDDMVAEKTIRLKVVKKAVVETVTATITAYTSSVDETDDTPFITASGTRTGEGTLACPPKYDFGTRIRISDKVYVCEDRMNRRYHSQERFDIWMETKDEAFEWGIRELEVEVLALN